MKRLLLGAVAVLAMLGQAQAANIPGQLQGSWCATNLTGVYISNPESCPENHMSVGRKDISIVVGTTLTECRVIDVDKIGAAYRVVISCDGNEPYAVEQRWTKKKDRLTVITTNRVLTKDVPLVYPNPPIYPKDKSQ